MAASNGNQIARNGNGAFDWDVLDDRVLTCRETEAIIVFEGAGFERWGYRTRIAILPPDAAPDMLSRLGRGIRRLRVESGESDGIRITPLSWDFAGD